jgi:hypothetical protein
MFKKHGITCRQNALKIRGGFVLVGEAPKPLEMRKAKEQKTWKTLNARYK